MLSESETDRLRQTRDRYIAQQLEFQQKISSYQEDTKTLARVRRQLPGVLRDLEDLAQKFATELTPLQQQIDRHKRQMPETKKFKTDSDKLTSDENQLAISREKLDKLIEQLAISTAEMQTQKDSEDSVDRDLSIVEEYCFRISEIGDRLQDIREFSFYFADLESELFSQIYEREAIAAQMLLLRSEEELFLQTVEQSKAKLEALMKEFDDNKPAMEILNVFPEKVDELKAVSAELQSIHQEFRIEMPKATEIRSNIHTLLSNQSQWCNEKLDVLGDLDREILRLSSFPEHGNLEIAKKLVKLNELERKLEDERQKLIRKQSNDPNVAELRANLEREENDKKEIAAEYMTGKAHVAHLSLLLDRKQRVISDLDRWCPLNSKVKIRPGIDEFFFIYDVILTRNRDVANDLQIITQELSRLGTDEKAINLVVNN
jgi:chromosome segregation ATPase